MGCPFVTRGVWWRPRRSCTLSGLHLQGEPGVIHAPREPRELLVTTGGHEVVPRRGRELRVHRGIPAPVAAGRVADGLHEVLARQEVDTLRLLLAGLPQTGDGPASISAGSKSWKAIRSIPTA